MYQVLIRYRVNYRTVYCTLPYISSVSSLYLSSPLGLNILLYGFYVLPLFLDSRYRYLAYGTGSFLALTDWCFVTYSYNGRLFFFYRMVSPSTATMLAGKKTSRPSRCRENSPQPWPLDLRLSWLCDHPPPLRCGPPLPSHPPYPAFPS
jgi:hypothetical protein